MRRLPAALVLTLIAVLVVSGCGDEQKVEPKEARNTAGMNVGQNVATATQYFAAVASNDPAHLEAAYETAAPDSPALSYLKLLHDGLTEAGSADAVSVNNGRYRVCKADARTRCHTFSQVVLVDGKVNDFTIDGKKLRIR